MPKRSQDEIVEAALRAVQARERDEPMTNPQDGMKAAMGNPSDLVSGSIAGSLIEAVTATLPDPWTPIIYHGHPNLPEGTRGPGEGSVMLMILAMDLGREIGWREGLDATTQKYALHHLGGGSDPVCVDIREHQPKGAEQ